MKKEFAIQITALQRFSAKVQLQQIKHLTINLSEYEAVLQEDFSKNFMVRHQDEIMSAHWVSNCVTLLTAIITTNTGNISYVVVSDSLDHCFNEIILKHVNENQTIKTLHVFTDGAVSQFKNRYTSRILNPMEFHPELKYMNWGFFATAHGKGPVDGVRETVKRAVWRRILQHGAIVNLAEEFANIAQESCPNVNIIFIPKELVSETQVKLDKKWSKCSPKQIPQMHSQHYVKVKNLNELEVSEISPFIGIISEKRSVVMFEEKTTPQINLTSRFSVLQIKKDSFVVVRYDGDYFPGIVEEVGENEYKVNVLHKCRDGWCWPNLKDSVCYSHEDIMIHETN